MTSALHPEDGGSKLLRNFGMPQYHNMASLMVVKPRETWLHI